MHTKPVFPDYAALNDSALIERSCDGDSNAFAELYRRYLTPVYRFIFQRVGGDVAVAEDLTSQVFLEALDGLSAYRERGKFVAWLFTITRRRLTDRFRKAAMDSLEDIPESLLGVSDGLEHRQTVNYLNQILKTLNDEQRELLQLRFSAELSFAEMAIVLGRNEAAIKMSLYRVLNKLREQWEIGNE